MVLQQKNLRNGLIRSLSFIITFISITTVNVSLPITSCSGSHWVWMGRPCIEEKTILGQKSVCVRQKSMDSPRGEHRGPEPAQGKKTRIMGAGGGRKGGTKQMNSSDHEVVSSISD